MTREEILEKSREENKGMDERELQSMFQGGYLSHSIGLVLCSLVRLLNSHFDGPNSTNYAVWFVLFGMYAAYFWTLAQKSRKKSLWVVMIASVIISLISAERFITHIIAGT